MFEDLEQKIRHDEEEELPRNQRWIRHALVLLISLILFGALYAVIKFVEA